MKLFIPGPTHVEQDVLNAMAQYPVGHRTHAYRELHNEVREGIKDVLMTKQNVMLVTSSATGLLEAGVRNLVGKRVLNLVCGAFSQRQADITKECDIPQDTLSVPWGDGFTPKQVDEALKNGDYDAVTLVHNETSTGVMNPLKEIAQIVQKYDDVLFIVDAVSSMSGVEIKMDEWGIDFIVASVQKAWALPPGFAILGLSDKALERAKLIPQSQRGHYFDILKLAKADAKNETPITPSIPHIYGLKLRLQKIREEGLYARFNRHHEMANKVRNWGKARFGLYAKDGFASDTLTCFTNDCGIDLDAFGKAMESRGFLISGGYGDLKGKTFRIAHLGALHHEDIDELIAVMDEVLIEL
jgi:predicted phosphoserine aminotransferase